MNRIDKRQVSRVPQDPDNVYLDLIITNLKSASTPPIPINFNENRNSPVISNTGNYNLSIVRFSLETQVLPVFIPVIKIFNDVGGYNSDPNLTIYSVTLEVLSATTGTTYIQQTFINWVPQNSLTLVPSPPSQTSNNLQSDSSDYYFCQSFTWWTDIILQTMARCFNSLKLQIDNAGENSDDVCGIEPPLIQFNPDNQTCSLACPSEFFDTYDQTVRPAVLNPNAVKLFFNPPLFSLFSSFPSRKTRYEALQGAVFQMLVTNFGGSNQISYPVTGSLTAVPPTAVLFTQVFQEYSTIQNWCPVSAIVFTTSTIPVIPNQLSSPLIFAEGNILTNTSGNNSNFQLVLTDLESGELCYKPNLQYSPTAEYRRISMTGTSPLTNIQLSVFWRNKLGNLVPFYLGSGSSATVKFLFTKVMAIYGEKNSGDI
tara:strand:+ start:44 stop:1324 length:1281 start_codon:yes stop_codon:yes gene_type:complete